MRGFSKAIIAGNLTRDPELRNTPSGATVCSFSVAVNRSYRDASGTQRDEVSYFDCSAWGKLGETISQYAKRGTGLIVSGRLTQRSWDDKTTGQKRSRVEINVEDFVFTGGRGDSDQGSSNYVEETVVEVDDAPTTKGKKSTKKDTPAEPEIIPDDIPDGEISLEDVPF